MARARTQTLVQLSDELVLLLDERAARERRSRSTLIREALEHHLGDALEAEVDRRIVLGHTRTPQDARRDGVGARRGQALAVATGCRPAP